MNNKIQYKSTIELNSPTGIYFYKIHQGDIIATGNVLSDFANILNYFAIITCNIH